MKKHIVMLILIFPVLSFSQNDNECRMLTVNAMNKAYANENSFNSYLKHSDIYFDNEHRLKSSNSDYTKIQDHADRTMLEASKENVFNIAKTMVDARIFDYANVPECSFKTLYFGEFYITTDFHRIEYRFMIPYEDMVRMKDSFNRQDFLSKIYLYGKTNY